MSESAFFLEGQQRHELGPMEVVIGREPPADLRFGYPQVSRRHARLSRTDRGYAISDLGSRFGTFLNGRPVSAEPVALQDGDELVLGGTLSLRYHDPSETRGGRRVGRLKGVWIDPQNEEVWVNGAQLVPPLSAAQLTLLKLLEARPGVFVSREQVVSGVWPEAELEGVSEEAVDGLIKRLRARLREGGEEQIEVRRGRGLRLLSAGP
ncbi:MAG: hypothetical protein AMXMBFR33_28410 [Candidatus Xenobia bacterium]